MSRGQQGIGISAAGMYGVQTTGKPVKIISQGRRQEAGPLLRDSDRHQEERAGDPQRQGRRRRHSRRREGRTSTIEKHGIEWVEQPHGTRVTIELEGQVRPRPRQRRRISGADGDRQSARHAALHRPRRQRSATTRARPTQLPPEPKEIKPHPYGVELGRLVDDAARTPKASTIVAVSDDDVLARQLAASPARFATTAKISARGPARSGSAARKPTRCFRRFKRRKIAAAGDRLHLADRRGADPQGPAPGRAGRVLRRGHAAAGRVSRQSVPDRSRPRLRRRRRRRRTSR